MTRTRRLTISLLSVLAFGLIPAANADQAIDARRAGVVAHVGTQTVTVAELEDRMRQVPPYQLATFGDTVDKRKRKFLEDVMIPDLLTAQGAESKHLDKALPTSYMLDHARSDAAIRAIRKNLPTAAQLPLEDVKKYYDENKSRYDAPERYNVWRILTSSREEADKVLVLAKKDLTLSTWNALARDRSIDKANYMRGGNLGFLTLEGTSNEASTTIEPAVVAAATKVKDGELVPDAVQEGPNFAVIWRRGTVGASHRALSEVDAQIRDTLWKQRGDAEVKRSTEDLRGTLLKDFNPGLLDTIDVTVAEGQIVPRKRPGQVSPSGTGL